jgi:hypothetical protein
MRATATGSPCKGRRAHCGGTHTAPGSGPPSMAPSSSAPAPASPTLSTRLPEGDVHPPRYVIICSCHPSCVNPISLEHSNRYKSVAFFFAPGILFMVIQRSLYYILCMLYAPAFRSPSVCIECRISFLGIHKRAM